MASENNWDDVWAEQQAPGATPLSTEWDHVFEARQGESMGKCPICGNHGFVGKRCEWCLRMMKVPLGCCPCVDRGPLGKTCHGCGCEFKKEIQFGTCRGCFEHGEMGDICKDCEEEDKEDKEEEEEEEDDKPRRFE